MTRDDIYHLARHLFGGAEGGGWAKGAAAATGYGERWWRRVVAGDADPPSDLVRYLALRVALEELLPSRARALDQVLPALSGQARGLIEAARHKISEDHHA